MKTEKNQTFTSLDVVTVLSLVIAVLSVAGAVMASVAIDSSAVQAKLGAEKLANQILLGGFESYKSPGDQRKPASNMTTEQRLKLLGNSGTLSRDPWGMPYQYRIGTDARGRKVAVVWSAGENRKLDTDLQTDDKGNFLRFEFAEDDLGVVVHR